MLGYVHTVNFFSMNTRFITDSRLITKSILATSTETKFPFNWRHNHMRPLCSKHDQTLLTLQINPIVLTEWLSHKCLKVREVAILP